MRNKKAQVIVGLVSVIVLSGGLYLMERSSEDFNSLKEEAQSKEKSSMQSAQATGNKLGATSLPTGFKPLSEIVESSKDVLQADPDGLVRGTTNPFNNHFQSTADVESFVDRKTKDLKVDLNAEEKNMLIRVRTEEVFNDKMDIGSSLDKLLSDIKKKREAEKNRSSTAGTDFSVVK